MHFLTELAREARERGELYVTKAQGEDVIANIEEVEAGESPGAEDDAMSNELSS